MDKTYDDTLPESLRQFAKDGRVIAAVKIADQSHIAPYLRGVAGLLAQANFALDCYEMALILEDDLIPCEQPPGIVIAHGTAWANTGSLSTDGLDTFFSGHGIETWDKMRDEFQEVLLRALWGHALLRFCAAMPNPTRHNHRRIPEAAKHTQSWLSRDLSIVDIYRKYMRIRNVDTAHSKTDQRGKTETYVARLRGDPTPRVFFEMSHDAASWFNPAPDDYEMLRFLVRDAAEFTATKIVSSRPLVTPGDEIRLQLKTMAVNP